MNDSQNRAASLTKNVPRSSSIAVASLTKTAAFSFFPVTPDHAGLFSVNPDVPIEDALNHVSCFLAAAHAMASEVATEYADDSGWALACMIETAKAVVDSLTVGMIRSSGGVQ